MNRRRFLAGVSIALPGAGAGCISNSDDPDDDGATDDGGSSDDSDDDSVPVLTEYTVSEEVVTPDVEQFSHMDAGGILIATRDVAQQYFSAVKESGSDSVDAFIEETDFDAGDRLLYVRAFGSQTCYELVLSEEPSVADNGHPLVQTGVGRTAPADQPCGDAITPVRMLLRLSFDPDAGSVAVVEVQVSGGKSETEELLLEAER